MVQFLGKRSDYIKRKIDWYLYNNNDIIIKTEKVWCEINNNIIKYRDDNCLNIIDLNKDIYIRDNEEFNFKIDFKTNEFMYTLKDIDKSILHNLTKCSIKKDNDIELIYSIDEEEILKTVPNKQTKITRIYLILCI